MRLSMVLGTLLAWPSAASRSEPMAGMATADPRALRIPVSAAISRVRREAVLRVQEGQERLRLCRRAMQVGQNGVRVLARRFMRHRSSLHGPVGC